MNPLILALIFLTVANYADYLSTLIGLTCFGLREANPHVCLIVSSQGGWLKWLILKTLFNLALTSPTLLLSLPHNSGKPLHLRILNVLRDLWLTLLSAMGVAFWFLALLNTANIINSIF